MQEAQWLGRLLEWPQGAVTDIEKLYQATVQNCESGKIGYSLISFDRIPKYDSRRWAYEAAKLRIARRGGACQDFGKRPKGGIKISSKCARPPFGPLQNGGRKWAGDETRVGLVSSPAHFRPPFCNGPKGGLAHLLDILIPPFGRLPKFWQAPPCVVIRNLAASFAHLRESYLGILSNEMKLYPILPLSQFWRVAWYSFSMSVTAPWGDSSKRPNPCASCMHVTQLTESF